MKYCLSLLAISALVLFTPGLAPGEAKVIWERNVGDAATPQFKFKNVPSPSKTDAAAAARLSIVAGRRDANGAGLEALCDGNLPGEEDQPDANFFFAAGTDGGRILMDLGQVTEIKQVCSYSWHANTRGPQVYKLYVSDGSAKDFNPKPGRSVAPEKAGWSLVASVDTRPKTGEPGGQYGVAISDSAGGTLAKCRHLLFDISATENDDPFGNTFYGEIDVSDGKEHVAPAVKKGSLLTAAAGGYEIVFDTTETPELTDWVNTKLRPICLEWYPEIVAMLPSEGYKPPQRFTVVFRRNMQGVAATGGTRVMCAFRWFQQNLEGEAAGAVVHEMVHVVQQYGRARGGNRNPGWLVEGIPDYIRWFLYEPPALRPRPNPAKAKYTDSYRITGAFLNYVTEKHDKDFVKKLNAAMRQGKYTPELWKTYTGKTVDELWAEYVGTLKRDSAQRATVTLESSKSYDFSTKTMGSGTTDGDLYYLVRDGTAMFWANNSGQRGVLDLGAVPLEGIRGIPKTGYNRFGVKAIVGHSYVSLAKEREDGAYIFFEVVTQTGSTVTIGWVRGTQPPPASR